MTIAADFDYRRPQTLEEATELLAAHSGEARVLAGGTDLVAWLRDDMVSPELLVDIKAIEGLDEILDNESSISIGPLVTFADLTRSDVLRRRLPLLDEMAVTVGSTGIRNRATLAGNICSAVPSCDAGPPLLVYEATVSVTGVEGTREIAIEDWFLGPRDTSLQRHEIVTGIEVPVPESHGAAYVRLSRYRGEDLAQASVAVLAAPGSLFRVAFGAVAATPARAPRIERVLQGRVLTDELIAEAMSFVAGEISPITDIRATEEFRRLMSEVMLGRGLVAAEARLQGNGPPYRTNLM